MTRTLHRWRSWIWVLPGLALLAVFVYNAAYAGVSLVFQVGLALVLAAVLEEAVRQRLRGWLRTIYFIPATMSITVAGILFSFLYNPEIGPLNRLLGFLGLVSWQH